MVINLVLNILLLPINIILLPIKLVLKILLFKNMKLWISV